MNRVAPVLPVRSVRRALAYYQKLGFAVKAYRERAGDEPIYGFLDWDAVQLHLALVRDLDPLTNTSACFLYVDDADALYARWASAGAERRLGAPVNTDYGQRELSHVDPDGNLLRVGSPIPMKE
jgi:catechol 2,3-dioxygenase-like lactoylglutathione lyase family enzyme